MEINNNGEVKETDNDELVADVANNAPPTQDAMATITTATAKEGRDDDELGAKDSGGNDEAENNKGGEE